MNIISPRLANVARRNTLSDLVTRACLETDNEVR